MNQRTPFDRHVHRINLLAAQRHYNRRSINAPPDARILDNARYNGFASGCRYSRLTVQTRRDTHRHQRQVSALFKSAASNGCNPSWSPLAPATHQSLWRYGHTPCALIDDEPPSLMTRGQCICDYLNAAQAASQTAKRQGCSSGCDNAVGI